MIALFWLGDRAASNLAVVDVITVIVVTFVIAMIDCKALRW